MIVLQQDLYHILQYVLLYCFGRSPEELSTRTTVPHEPELYRLLEIGGDTIPRPLFLQSLFDTLPVAPPMLSILYVLLTDVLLISQMNVTLQSPHDHFHGPQQTQVCFVYLVHLLRMEYCH
jgi:hypothetical protein